MSNPSRRPSVVTRTRMAPSFSLPVLAGTFRIAGANRFGCCGGVTVEENRQHAWCQSSELESIFGTGRRPRSDFVPDRCGQARGLHFPLPTL
jgi:hypothetical protein